MITQNRPIFVKGWNNTWFQIPAFGGLFLGFMSLIGIVTAAQPSATPTLMAENGNNTPNLEMTFAKYSEPAKDKAAGCLIVSSTVDPTQRKIYCRYSYQQVSLCDEKSGVNFSNIRLDVGINAHNNLTTWLISEFPNHRLTAKTITETLAFISNDERKFPNGKKVFGQSPETIILTKLETLPPPEQYQTVPQKGFAWLVHHSIEPQLKKRLVLEPDESNTATNTSENLSDNTLLDQNASNSQSNHATTDNSKILINPSEGTQLNNIQSEAGISESIQLTTPIDFNHYAQLLLGIVLLVVIIILAILLWFFLAKKAHTQLVSEISREMSSMLENQYYQLQTQQQKQYKTSSQQNQTLSEEIKNSLHSDIEQIQANFFYELKKIKREMALSKLQPNFWKQPNESDSEQPAQQSGTWQTDVKDELAFSQQMNQLEQEKRRLEQLLNTTKNKLSSEEEQRDKIEAALEQTKNELNTVFKQYRLEQEQRQKLEKALEEAMKNRQTLSQQNENEQTKYQQIEKELEETQNALQTLSQQYEQTERQQLETTLEKSNPITHHQPELENAQNQIKTLQENQQTLQNLLSKRFRIVKPGTTELFDWTTALIEQPETWYWAQPALLGELLACETQVNQIKEQQKNHEIVELLELDTILWHWNTLIGQVFDSDSQLWPVLRETGSGKWLNLILRANDLLQTYFQEEYQWTELSKHLSNVSGILEAMFVEMGIELKKPKLLAEVPDYVPENHCREVLEPALKKLIKSQLQERSKTERWVVDIETYGFVTADNPNADVRVVISTPEESE